MNWILTRKCSIVSAKLLRDVLSGILGIKILITTDSSKIKSKDYLILRYGNSDSVNCEDLSINSPEFIQIASNKYIFSRILLENGFHTPKYSSVYLPEEKNFPVLIRESLTESHGRGIHVVENLDLFKEIWRAGFYWTRFVELDYEFRVHVIGNKIIKIFLKQLEEESQYPIKNNDSCHFSLREKTENNFKILQDTIIELSKIFGDALYGLDIAWDSLEKKYFILEANSAPGINLETAKLFAEFIVKEYEIYWSRKTV